VRNVSNLRRLHFYHSIRNKIDQLGHQPVHNPLVFKELNPDREMFATAARRTMRVNAMV
jgi:hypothetical protein